MTIAYLQTDISYLDPDENHRRVENLLRTYLQVNRPPDLLVLPELLSSGYFFQSTDDCAAVAEAIPGGKTTKWLGALADKHKMHVVCGLAERDSGQLYNSAVLTGPEGYVGKYRKVHLYYQEKIHFEPGDASFPVFELETRDGTTFRLGVMICFDWYFPESARTLAISGADVIAHPSNLVRPNCPRAMPIRALENHVYTVTANRIGKEEHEGQQLTFIGQSQICSPSGETLSIAGREEEVIRAVEIDPRKAADKDLTVHNNIVTDRRPELYRLA